MDINHIMFRAGKAPGDHISDLILMIASDFYTHSLLDWVSYWPGIFGDVEQEDDPMVQGFSDDMRDLVLVKVNRGYVPVLCELVGLDWCGLMDFQGGIMKDLWN